MGEAFQGANAGLREFTVQVLMQMEGKRGPHGLFLAPVPCQATVYHQ